MVITAAKRMFLNFMIRINLIYPCLYLNNRWGFSLHFHFICIRFIRVEYLIAVHNRYQVFRIGEIDDVMGISGKRDNVDCILSPLTS